jgi:hypothetical protein
MKFSYVFVSTLWDGHEHSDSASAEYWVNTIVKVLAEPHRDYLWQMIRLRGSAEIPRGSHYHFQNFIVINKIAEFVFMLCVETDVSWRVSASSGELHCEIWCTVLTCWNCKFLWLHIDQKI